MTTTTIDDEISTARADIDALEAELASRRAAATAAQAELDQLEAQWPDIHSSHRGEVTDRWARDRAAATKRHGQAIGGVDDLERRLREQRRQITALGAKRIPKFDDAIAEARARLAVIPQELTAVGAEVKILEARIRGFDVDRAIDDPLPAGEPANTAAELERTRAGIRELAAENERLELRLATLLERRDSAAAGQVDETRQELQARWEASALELLDTVVRLQTIAGDMREVDDAYRATGGRIRTAGDDPLWAPFELETMVTRARRLQLAEPS